MIKLEVLDRAQSLDWSSVTCGRPACRGHPSHSDRFAITPHGRAGVRWPQFRTALGAKLPGNTKSSFGMDGNFERTRLLLRSFRMSVLLKCAENPLMRHAKERQCAEFAKMIKSGFKPPLVRSRRLHTGGLARWQSYHTTTLTLFRGRRRRRSVIFASERARYYALKLARTVYKHVT